MSRIPDLWPDLDIPAAPAPGSRWARLLAAFAEARRHGFDYVGVDSGAPSPEHGFACRCHWSSSYHGDRCPEHGCVGIKVPEK